MSIQTLSIVVGTKACNASCPFCVSKQTGFEHMGRGKDRDINYHNLETTCAMCGTGTPTTLLMTGKGEPTLYPNEITSYLEFFRGRPFAPIELQTNGLAFGRLARDGESGVAGLDSMTLDTWRALGLNTIALSVVGIRNEANARIYHPDYPDLATTVAYLRGFGYTIRFCVMMMHGDGCVRTPEDIEEALAFCRRHDIGQLTVRPIRSAQAPKNKRAAQFARDYGISDPNCELIYEYVESHATKLRNLMHGATVFDFDGQNICVSDCLTVNSTGDGEDIRTLIFFSDGDLVYDWQYRGALLLQGWRK
ncbi:MAG: hypothetical protein U9Q03_02000 [Patescibacteria group bacterium]|nr:hypothetical protein [Patescibacteria group bacterium]